MSDTEKQLEKVVKELLDLKAQVEAANVKVALLEADVAGHCELYNGHIKDLHMNNR